LRSVLHAGTGPTVHFDAEVKQSAKIYHHRQFCGFLLKGSYLMTGDGCCVTEMCGDRVPALSGPLDAARSKDFE
jgi:hypothetical protein